MQQFENNNKNSSHAIECEVCSTVFCVIQTLQIHSQFYTESKICCTTNSGDVRIPTEYLDTSYSVSTLGI